MSSNEVWNQPEQRGVIRIVSTTLWAAASLGVFVGAVTWAYNLGTRSSDDIPALNPDHAIYLKKPEATDGKEFAGQDIAAHNPRGDDTALPAPGATVSAPIERPTAEDVAVARERLENPPSEQSILAAVDDAASRNDVEVERKIVGLDTLPPRTGDGSVGAATRPATPPNIGTGSIVSEAQPSSPFGGASRVAPIASTEARSSEVAPSPSSPSPSSPSLTSASPSNPLSAVPSPSPSPTSSAVTSIAPAPQVGASRAAPVPSVSGDRIASIEVPASRAATPPNRSSTGQASEQETGQDALVAPVVPPTAPANAGNAGTALGGSTALSEAERIAAEAAAALAGAPNVAEAPKRRPAAIAAPDAGERPRTLLEIYGEQGETLDQVALGPVSGSQGGGQTLTNQPQSNAAQTAQAQAAPVSGSPVIGTPQQPASIETQPVGGSSASTTPPVRTAAVRSDHVVQLAALASESAVRERWAVYQQRAPQLLSGRSLIVEPVKVKNSVTGGDSTLYRLRVAASNRGEARQLCQSLTERGFTCFVPQP